MSETLFPIVDLYLLIKYMLKVINHKGLFDLLPLISHTRDCWVAKYTDYTEIKIPLQGEKVNTKPVVIYDKDYIKIIFKEVDGFK